MKWKICIEEKNQIHIKNINIVWLYLKKIQVYWLLFTTHFRLLF